MAMKSLGLVLILVALESELVAEPDEQLVGLLVARVVALVVVLVE